MYFKSLWYTSSFLRLFLINWAITKTKNSIKWVDQTGLDPSLKQDHRQKISNWPEFQGQLNKKNLQLTRLSRSIKQGNLCLVQTFIGLVLIGSSEPVKTVNSRSHKIRVISLVRNNRFKPITQGFRIPCVLIGSWPKSNMAASLVVFAFLQIALLSLHSVESIAMNRYHKYDDMKRELENFARTYPNMTELYSIGKSVLGK